MPDKLKELALITSLLGILILIILTLLSRPLQISSQAQLDNLTENQKVIITSKVVKESQTEFSKTIYLENRLRVYSDPKTPSYQNQNVRIIAKVEKYNDKNSLQLLKISPE